MRTIIVTVENQDTFKKLKECESIIISENAKAEFPSNQPIHYQH